MQRVGLTLRRGPKFIYKIGNTVPDFADRPLSEISKIQQIGDKRSRVFGKTNTVEYRNLVHPDSLAKSPLFTAGSLRVQALAAASSTFHLGRGVTWRGRFRTAAAAGPHYPLIGSNPWSARTALMICSTRDR